jgi:hypothetical protein
MKISPSTNATLTIPFTSKKSHCANKVMAKNKALRCDGIVIEFNVQFWHIVQNYHFNMISIKDCRCPKGVT